MLRLSTNCRRARFGEVYFVRRQAVEDFAGSSFDEVLNLGGLGVDVAVHRDASGEELTQPTVHVLAGTALIGAIGMTDKEFVFNELREASKFTAAITREGFEVRAFGQRFDLDRGGHSGLFKPLTPSGESHSGSSNKP